MGKVSFLNQSSMHRPRGVADGGSRGHDPRTFENGGVDPTDVWIFQYLFCLEAFIFLYFPAFLKIKWPKSDEKLNFGDR